MISFWEQSFYEPQDFIIAGAGLAGLWCALELKKAFANASIAIVESGHIPSGASTRNAGFACFGSPTEMIHDIQTFGVDHMQQMAEMRFKGIQKIRKMFTDTDIDYDACGGYECFNTESHSIPQIHQQVAYLNTLLKPVTGSNETFCWVNHKLARFGFYGMDSLVENKLEGALHSGKLITALTQKAFAAGVKILYATRIISWVPHQHGVRIETNRTGMQAGQLLLCTNALLPELAPSVNVQPARGQILVTSPIHDLQLHGTFHYQEGYYYFRNIGNRLLIGGARNKAFQQEFTTETGITDIIQSELERFLRYHLPKTGAFTITHRWGGTMGFTNNKQPLVLSLNNKVHAVVACNGMGVALTPVVAEQAVKLCRHNY